MARQKHHGQPTDMVAKLAAQELIDGVIRGDATCIEQFIRQYSGRMLAVAKRIVRNEADAQDCVQEAFLKALNNLD